MKSRLAIALGVSTCLALSACGKSKPPEGQVAATVNGKEITMIDLRNEMGTFVPPDAKTRQAANRQALDAIISRRILADAAHKAGIDKTPDFAQQKQRVDETLLIQSWQKKIVDGVPPPSKDEIQRFVAANPNLYAEHKIFTVDQIRFARPNDPAFAALLRPINSLPEIEQLLTQKGMKFQTSAGEIDSLTLPPPVIDQILKLPPGELFMVPNGNLLVVNKITDTKIVPVPADVANRHAQAFLTDQRAREAVQKVFGGAFAVAKDKVKFNKAFQPAKPAAAPAATAAVAPAPK